MDTKCPFIERHQEDPALVDYATGLVEYLDTEAGLEYLRTNPKVVGPAWPEYLWMGALPRATGWIQAPLRKPPHPSLRPFREEDLPALKKALRARPRSASHYTLASLIGWSDLIRLWRAPLKEGGWALFSEQAGGLFLPVPPLGDPEGEGPVREAWKILEQANQGSAVSRIEGIETAAVGGFKEMGFSVRPAETEYLYETASLARLSGDGYRSQRWAVNRCLKSIPVRIRQFEQGDIVPCLQLYTRWAIRRQKAASDDLEKRLLRDSLFYHRRLMMDRERLGLWGRVLESRGKILAYTFGGEISKETFGVFAEIADREIPGLAQTLFREFCREIEKSGFRRLNAMGDAGLPALRAAKMAYRPSALLPLFTATKE